ncbi:MAG: recombinase [Verrucomicrobia bacterium]|nr:recombinase [Verrucomicrobiota bacterium]
MSAHTHPVSHPANGLQDFIAISRYARYSPEKRRRETWAEAVARVRNMHLAHFSERSLSDAKLVALEKGDVTREELATIERLGGSLHASIRAAFDAVARREVLPSMRSLQFGGEAILTKHARVYNCCFTYIDRLEAFRETLYLLLCGCGVGFSVQTHHVAKLPALAPRDESLPPVTHVVADTIEGWGDAFHALMANAVAGRTVHFDYSQIRPEGAPLRTSGGKAPGSAPLFHTLSRAERIVRAAAGRKLRPIEAYDILMWAAKAVLSGGVRRSATICLFSVDDAEMVASKTGNWFVDQPQRTASNNSAVIVRATATRAQFDALFEAQKQYGEPGFYFVEDTEYGANPCVEIGLHPRLKLDLAAIARLRELGHQGELRVGDEVTGVQFCNLSTISAAAAETPADFYRLCAHAALIGTLQAGYTEFNYLSPVSRVITEREALLGVSLCGILDRPGVFLDPAVLRAGAAVVKAVNAVVARALGIQPAARTTCVKPEGTASLLLGTSSGLHPHHAPRYFRRVQANVHDPVYKHFRKSNPHMIEPSVYDPNGRTEVITFPVEGPDFGIYREDLSAVKHLEYVRLVQENWVQAGRRHEHTSPGLHHNVSCTISVRPDEWSAVADFVWAHRHAFTGIAMLQDCGDKVYQQAPREGVVTAADIEKWNTLCHQPVDYTTLEESEDITDLKQVVACAGGACEVV